MRLFFHDIVYCCFVVVVSNFGHSIYRLLYFITAFALPSPGHLSATFACDLKITHIGIICHMCFNGRQCDAVHFGQAHRAHMDFIKCDTTILLAVGHHHSPHFHSIGHFCLHAWQAFVFAMAHTQGSWPISLFSHAPHTHTQSHEGCRPSIHLAVHLFVHKQQRKKAFRLLFVPVHRRPNNIYIEDE